MDRESLENTSRLHSLEAENKHLKSLLSRVVIPKNETQVESPSFLTSSIEQLLLGDWQYSKVISAILKELAVLVGVDRVSIYSYDLKKENYAASNQWVSDGVQEYHPSDLTFSKKENPLKTPNSNGCFASSNISKDIEQSLAEKLETFQVQSILIIPFSGAEFSEGMFVFESCQFNREWYDFEVIEISKAIRFISNYLTSIWHKSNADQAFRLGKELNKINKNLKEGKKTKKAINEVLSKLGQELDFNSIYLVEKGSYSNDREVHWAKTIEIEERCLSITELEKLKLDFSNELCILLSPEELQNGVLGFGSGERSLVISAVIVNKEFKGWLVGEPDLNITLSEELLMQFWESIGFILSETLTEYVLDVELNAKKHKLQEASRQLAFKDTFLNNVLNYSPFGTVIVKDGLIKYANKQFADVIGYKQEDIINQKMAILNYGAKGGDEELSDLFYSKIEENGLATEEITITNKSDQQKRISLFGSKGTGEKGSYLIFTLDITESYFAKKEIQESRARYQKILESTVDGVIILNIAGAIHFVNQSFCGLLGYEYEEAKLLKYTDFVCEEHIPIFEDIIKRLDQGSDFKGDSILRKKDDTLLEAEVCGALIQLEGENYYFFSIHDISRRKHNEKILSAREVQFRSLAENSPDIILRLNNKGQIQFYNQALLEQFSHLVKNEIIGKNLEELEVLDELVGATWQAKINDVFVSGEKLSMDLGFSDETKELYYDWNLSPEINSEGSVETILAIGRNLTPRKSAEKQLLLAKEKAEESDKLKSAFLANISHELRTPLNAIVGFSALLRGDDVPSSERDEYIDVIHKNSDSLMNLINNIIDVAKIESGKISVVKETVSIDSMMTSLYESFLPKVDIEHKGRVKLYYSKPKESGIKLDTDPIRLKQVLVNLIGNAIKFTIKGFVEFGYELDNNEVRFFVKDTGIGISEAKQRLIFQPFRKEDESTDQIFGGTGIGLPISEKLVNALGGSIGLISEKGQGSEFFFTHPMTEIIKEVTPAKESLQRTYTISQPVLPKNYHWHDKLVLLVDENSSAHLQMRKFIEKTGLTLVSARTAAGASKLLMNRTDIHLVLMDLSFPDSDGYELIRVIKKQNKNLPVIAHSVKAFNGEREKLLQSGFDECVSKPTDKEELLMVMDKFLVEADTKI